MTNNVKYPKQVFSKHLNQNSDQNQVLVVFINVLVTYDRHVSGQWSFKVTVVQETIKCHHSEHK